MIWKGFGVLLGSALVVVLMVVGLARLIVPDEPTFSEGLEEAAEESDDDGTVDFTPTAVGGQLEITGAAEGTITLERTAHGPTYGLENSKTRVFFESGPLSISQMSHEGLAFFPEPENCEFTEGGHNEDLGLIGVAVSCPELVDIRGNGTITLDGVLALPANLVVELDLPEMGGTVTIGDEAIDFGPDLHLFVGPSPNSGTSEIQLTAVSDSPQATLVFPYDLDSGLLRLGRVGYSGGSTDVDTGECTHDLSELVVISPQSRILQLDFSCAEVRLANIGRVPIEGTLVFEELLMDTDH